MASPFCRYECRVDFSSQIKKTLINDYELKDSYELDEIISCILEEYSIYESYEPHRKNFIRRINSLIFYPLIYISMPFKWFFTGNLYYDGNKKIGRFLKWLVEG